MDDSIPVSVRLDGLTVPSATRVVSAAAEVLVLSTTVSSPQAPISLHSTYVGSRSQETAVTHLLLTPAMPLGELTQFCDASGELPVANDDRHLCLYDHLQRLLSALEGCVRDAAIDVDDHAIELVDR